MIDDPCLYQALRLATMRRHAFLSARAAACSDLSFCELDDLEREMREALQTVVDLASVELAVLRPCDRVTLSVPLVADAALDVCDGDPDLN